MVFDNVHRGPRYFWDGLIHLGKFLPANFYVAYAFDTESPTGWQFEDAVGREFKILAEIDISPMNCNDVRRWIALTKPTSRSITDSLLDEVCDVLDGRPFFIDWWLNSVDFEAGLVRSPGGLDKLFGAAFKELSPQAQRIAQLTGVIPAPFPHGLEDYATILECSVGDTHVWVKELIDKRIFRDSRRVLWFRHSLVHAYVVRVHLPDPVRTELVKQIFKRIANLNLKADPSYQKIVGTLLHELFGQDAIQTE